MNLSVLEGHFPVACPYKYDISYLWRVVRSLCICRSSCQLPEAPSIIQTIAEHERIAVCLYGHILLGQVGL